eukprot:7906754-Karenia_brevis.AAC.1
MARRVKKMAQRVKKDGPKSQKDGPKSQKDSQRNKKPRVALARTLKKPRVTQRLPFPTCGFLI